MRELSQATVDKYVKPGGAIDSLRAPGAPKGLLVDGNTRRLEPVTAFLAHRPDEIIFPQVRRDVQVKPTLKEFNAQLAQEGVRTRTYGEVFSAMAHAVKDLVTPKVDAETAALRHDLEVLGSREHQLSSADDARYIRTMRRAARKDTKQSGSVSLA